jgi:hypothetical protein
MNMGDVFAIFGTLLAVGIALPGMLLAWTLLFPSLIERAHLRLERMPWRCFWLGSAWLLMSGLSIAFLLNLPAGAAKLLGWTGIVLLLTLASMGAAGMAALMGERLGSASPAAISGSRLLRGALALELAAAFPIVGWFVVIPLVAICGLGAAGLALLRGAPRTRPALSAETQPANSALPNA